MVTPDPGVIEVNVHPTSSWTEFAELTANLYETARQCRLGTETFGLDGRHSGTGGGNHITLGGSEPAKSPMLLRPDLLVSMLTYWQHHPSLSYLFSGRFIGPTSQAPRVDEGRPETLYELEIAFSEIERLVDRPDDEWDHRPWAVDRALRHLLTDITGNTHRAEFCIDKMYSPDSSRGRLGLLELRGFEMPPHPDMALVQALLVRSILARVGRGPVPGAADPLGHPAARAVPAAALRGQRPRRHRRRPARHQIDIDLAWFDPYLEFRFPRIGISQIGDVDPGAALRHRAVERARRGVQLRRHRPLRRLLGRAGAGAGHRLRHRPARRHLQRAAGAAAADRTPGSYVAGVRYKAWKPWSALHPTLEIDTPLVFDVVDLGNRLSLGGATYHVVHPGGRSYDHPPVNAKEAEARRARRFEPSGHTTGAIDIDALAERAAWRGSDADDYPLDPRPAAAHPTALGSRMTVLERYLGSQVQPDMFAVGVPVYDEFAGPRGQRPRGLDGAGRRASQSTPARTCGAPSGRWPGCSRTTASPTPRARPRRSPSPTRPPRCPASRRSRSRSPSRCPGGSTRCRWCCEEREWSALEAGRGAARRAARRDPGRPVRGPEAVGRSAPAGGGGARPRRVPAHRGRHRHRQPVAVHGRRRPRPGRRRPLEGHVRPDPGAVRRRLRDAEPAGRLPGDAGGLPRGRTCTG